MSDLRIATWDYDRVRALIDGRVAVSGAHIAYTVLPPEECFHRAWSSAEFEVTELGVMTYLMALSRGRSRYIALPVFPSRSFRHSAIYIRSDRAIERPQDLRGRRVGVPIYEMAAAVWVRGLLHDEYDVAADEVRWCQAGLGGLGSNLGFTPPDGVPIEYLPQGASLSELLAHGELDAVISARAPACFMQGDPHVARLFPDFRSAERDYYARTGIFPIMHVLAVREDVVEQHPEIGAALFRAFDEAKRIAQDDLREITAPKISLPWAVAELEATERLMGEDFWPYGIAPNRRTLEAMCAYAFEQGLVARPLGVQDVFFQGRTDAVS